MTAGSLEHMDIKKCWVSSVKMTCQTSTAASLNYCMFVGFSVFSFVCSNWSVLFLVEVSLLTLLLENIPFLSFEKSWVALALYLGSLSICTVKRHSYPFCSIWPNVSREFSASEITRILLSAVTSSINSSEAFPSAAIHTHPCHNTTSNMFDTLCGDLDREPFPYISSFFSLPITLIQVYPGFICPKNLIPELLRLFLDVFWQSVIRPSSFSMLQAVCTLL